MNSLQFISTQVDKVIGQQNGNGHSRNLSQRSSPLSKVVEEDEKDASLLEKDDSESNLRGQQDIAHDIQGLGSDTQSRTFMSTVGLFLFYIPELITRSFKPSSPTPPAYIDSSQLQLQSPPEKNRDNRHRRPMSVSSGIFHEKENLAAVRRGSAASTNSTASGHTVFIPPPRPLLSHRLGKPKRLTLVLDLDETLIHSVSRGSKFSASQMVEVKLDNQLATLYFVNKRPHCDEFLRFISQWYRLVIFTASVQAYADPMIDWLEKEEKYFSGRYYREHCTPTSNGGYIKDLTKITSDLSSVIIIDNSPLSYSMHQRNAISIEGWVSDPSDHSLLYLLPILQALRYSTDVRSFLGLTMGEESFEY